MAQSFVLGAGDIGSLAAAPDGLVGRLLCFSGGRAAYFAFILLLVTLTPLAYPESYTTILKLNPKVNTINHPQSHLIEA